MSTEEAKTLTFDDLKAHTTRDDLYVLLSGKGERFEPVISIGARVSRDFPTRLSSTGSFYLTLTRPYATVYNVSKFMDEVCCCGRERGAVMPLWRLVRTRTSLIRFLSKQLTHIALCLAPWWRRSHSL